jgi:hypothetical protein
MKNKTQAVAISNDLHKDFASYCRRNRLKIGGMVEMVLKDWLISQLKKETK